jgi:tryptophan-rich sensory protein
MNNILKLALSVALPLAVGALGSCYTIPEISGWYQTIQKPSWNPPNWIFGPVWTTLYVLMGIALYLVWKTPGNNNVKSIAVSFFMIQLGLNFFWSVIFFNQHRIGLALAEIVLLWIFILVTILSFSKVNKVAPWLLVPYISWVSFAMILNYSIWQLNK